MDSFLIFMENGMKKIVIQGYPGAFHEIAARTFFPHEEVEIVPCDTFEEVVTRAEQRQGCDLGIMAIENTISGSLLSNYNLLNNSKLKIIGEVYLRIHQNLMALPGVRLQDLTEVYSHPIAIAQCREFFESQPQIKLVEHIDTALSAKLVRDNNWRHIGAIASTLAADKYGLKVLKHSIETNKKNFTRFLVVESNGHPPDFDQNKVSMVFSVSHEIGSLHKVLSILAFHDANLSKIQSVPILGKPFEYLFFVDFVLEKTERLKILLESIRPFTGRMKILGIYPKGDQNVVETS